MEIRLKLKRRKYIFKKNGHEFEQASGEGERQGSLAC